MRRIHQMTAAVLADARQRANDTTDPRSMLIQLGCIARLEADFLRLFKIGSRRFDAQAFQKASTPRRRLATTSGSNGARRRGAC